MLNSNRSEMIFTFGIITATALGLYISSFYSYLLFHSLIEIATIVVAFTLFILTWNTRKILSNNYLTVLGIGYAFIALMDLLHMLAYKGMNVFPGFGANLPTQLWIAARFLQAVTLFTAPLFLERRMNHRAVFCIYGAATSLLVATIYTGAFPDCFIEGKGLTTFKIGSEYLIVAILLASLYLFHRMRKHFDRAVYLLTFTSIACTVFSGIMFTSYVNVYDVSNMAGHFAKLAAFYLIYRALLVTGLQEPFDLIFRDLVRTEEELREAHDTLEEKVRERTAALRESEQKYRSLAENSPDNIVRYDRQCRAIYCTSMLAQTVAIDPDIMLGKTPVEFWEAGPEVAAEYEEHIRRALEIGASSDMKLIMPHPDGGLRTHLIRFAAERDTEGHIVGVLAIGRDITERKQAEQQIELLNHALDNVHEAAFLIDLQGRFLYVNQEACRSLGYGRDELLGMAIPDIDPEFSAKHVARHFAELLEVRMLMFETSHRTREGHVFPVEVSTSVFEFGDTSYFLSLVRDITVRKRMKERLTAREHEFRTLAESLPDNIVRYNREAVTVYVNPVVEKTVGCTAADMIGTRIRERHMNGSYEAYAQAVDNVLASGEDGEIEFIVPVPALEAVVHQIRVIAERGEQGEVIGALAIGRDITERKLAEEQLRERERKFRTLAENSPDSILRYDTACRCIYANPRIETILGIPAGGLLGKTPMELFSAGGFREYQDRIEEVLRIGTNAEMEIVVPDFGEGVQHHHVRFTAERGEHDDVVGVLVIGHDITERKQMEQTLRESEERFRLLVELSPDLIFIRHDEWIVYANPAAARMVGADSAEELIGKSVLDFALPERREPLKMLIAANSTKQIGEVMPPYDGTLVRLDGSLVPIELTAVRFQYRGMSCSQLIMRDITGRKREEQMTQARLRMLNSAYAVGLSLDDTLRMMLDEIEARTGSCIGFYYFWEEEQQTLSLHGWSTNTVATMCATEGAGSHYAVDQAGVWADCVRERRPVIHNDYASLPHRRGMPGGHATVVRELVVPIFRGDRIVAIIGVGNKLGEYNNADVQLAMLLGDFSWEIVSHKQAEEMLLAKQQRLTDMTMELSLAEERERRRIATELHDNISQSLLLGKIKLRTLIGAALPTQSLQALNEILKIQDQTIKSVRSLTQQLSPPILSIAGLEDALEWLAERMQEDYGLCVVFVDDKQLKPLTEDMRAIVFQTCRELLINVAKHAETESARVVIGREGGRLCLTVDDRGKGFDLSGSAVNGFGLFSIRERIKYLGGDVSIESAPGQGTQVTLRVALAEG